MDHIWALHRFLFKHFYGGVVLSFLWVFYLSNDRRLWKSTPFLLFGLILRQNIYSRALSIIRLLPSSWDCTYIIVCLSSFHSSPSSSSLSCVPKRYILKTLYPWWRINYRWIRPKQRERWVKGERQGEYGSLGVRLGKKIKKITASQDSREQGNLERRADSYAEEGIKKRDTV